MILIFPDLATFRLALTCGAVPATISAARAVGSVDAGGPRVEVAARLSRSAQTDLKRLGVRFDNASTGVVGHELSCWAELLPLQPEPGPPAVTDQTPVLFELPGAALTQLVTEMLRLGNDRQSFRWLEDDRGQAQVLLRVAGPPYYSLLRAIHRIGKSAAPTAFVERAPRVWIELGYTHPLCEQVQPAEGKMLLLRAPGQWTQLDEAPYRDIYEVLEIPLPAVPATRQDTPPQERIRVPLTLKAGGSADGAELWVLSESGFDELNRFVQNADDNLLERLAFAAGTRDGQTTFVVRVRQTRQGLPVLVLNANPYKPYLKLPNLFVPAGMRLHPPLRRDVVRRLLADDPERVTWLTPGANGTFIPESLPENAFRPLADWVEYVLDRERQALLAWVQAARFEFESFVCADEQPATKKAPDGEPRRSDKDRGKARDSAGPNDLSAHAPTTGAGKSASPKKEADSIAASHAIEPSVAQQRLKELEERFVAAAGGLDNPQRTALWPELAALYTTLSAADDAAICWMNALWGQPEPSTVQAWSWFCVEASAVSARSGSRSEGRSWASRLTLAGRSGRDITGEDLYCLLALEDPDAADVRALAAYLVFAAVRQNPPAELMQRLDRVQRFLETNERLLPVRGVWLAWSHLARLAGQDVLGLARARDRLLGRLFAYGVRPDLDLPLFLRHAGKSHGWRYRVEAQWLLQLCERGRQWAGKQGCDALYHDKDPRTADYIDLLFAFGLARLGKSDQSRRLLQRASLNLGERDDVHKLLLAGFRHRIEQALGGKPHGGPLPLENLEYLEVLAKDYQGRPKDGPSQPIDPRYIVDRTRSFSRVLEPDQRIDAFRCLHMRTDDELAKTLAGLSDVTDGKVVAAIVQRLLGQPPKKPAGPAARVAILRHALDQAPRVGEEFAGEILALVPAAFDAMGSGAALALTMARAELLEKAMFVAAHFDRVECIPHLLSRFEKLLQEQKGGATITAIETLAGQCLRGLRKLGMREEIDRLLTQMADVVLQGKPLASLDGRIDKAAALRALLHVASGWYYFGQDGRAGPVLKAARTALCNGEWAGSGRDHADLACTYIATIGQAPVEIARRRLEEIFERVTGVRDTYTTNVYYSLSQLRVVEAVVLAVASDDFAFGSRARRWLDDDEFLIRRRIHREFREMTGR